MLITRPTSNPDLIIIEDFLTKEEIELIRNNSYYKAYFSESRATDAERDALGWVPEKPSTKDLDEYSRIIPLIKERIISQMRTIWSETNFHSFDNFGHTALRTSGFSMKPHVDAGPEGTEDSGNNSDTALLYINDDFEGGELFYPELNFYYKPVPGQLVLHRGRMPFKHGVTEVISGWRFNLGVFGFSKKN